MLGLGFGDCGKGLFVDALTRRWQAHTVVRFNGGAQAGHNVVDAAGRASRPRHHTFSQFGAGTLVPGTCTVIADPVVLHPTALLVEAEALGRIGVTDALTRLMIDSRCRVTTPYHQAAGRLRERLRGAAAHGTCGVGFGETVRHALAHPEQAIRYGDLARAGSDACKLQRDKLHVIREALLAEFSAVSPPGEDTTAMQEFTVLQDDRYGEQWLLHARALARHCRPASKEEIGRQLSHPGAVLFEGAQGVLLDEWHGFHPHTTWSSIGTPAVEAIADRFGVTSPIQHFGVLRTYLTRHGPGPFPTHDPQLDSALPEPHNDSAGWQGAFRRGHPDAVLLRYARHVGGKLSGLLVSHMDVFQRGHRLRWCSRYAANSWDSNGSDIEQLPVSRAPNLDLQSRLTQTLLHCRPVYDGECITDEGTWLERVSAIAGLPTILRAYGPTADDVRG